MKVLLSIKPEFADKIFDGSKKFEFRRSIFKNKAVRTIVVYASAPVQRVIGEFDIDAIHHQELETLWQKTSAAAGISEQFYFKYFGDKTMGYAIEIKDPRLYATPQCLRNDFNLFPPQSFVYLAE